MGRKLMTDSKLTLVATAAEEAFWDAVAKAFPEIKTGDLSPEATVEFRSAVRDAICAWYSENTPMRTYDVSYCYSIGLGKPIHAVATVEAQSEDEAIEIVKKGETRTITMMNVEEVYPVAPKSPTRWRVEFRAPNGGEKCRWVWAYTAEAAEIAVRSEWKLGATDVKGVVADPPNDDDHEPQPVPIVWTSPPCAEVAKQRIEIDHDAAAVKAHIAANRADEKETQLIPIAERLTGELVASYNAPGHAEALNEDWAAFTKLLPEHNGWRASWEHPGFLGWNKKGHQLTVVATPDWDSGDNEEIVCDLQDESVERLVKFGRPEMEKHFIEHGLVPWPKDERTVESYMRLVAPKLHAVDALVAEYHNAVRRALTDEGFEEEGDFEITPDVFCPIDEEAPGAWVSVQIWIDQRDLTGERKEDK